MPLIKNNNMGSQANYQILNLKLNTDVGVSLGITENTSAGRFQIELKNNLGKVLDTQLLPAGNASEVAAAELVNDSGWKINFKNITGSSIIYTCDLSNLANDYLNKIQAESDLRITNDSRIELLIENEANTRNNSDLALQTSINSVSANVSNLDGKLTAEISTRNAADIQLQANIDTEIETRSQADQTLQTNINTVNNSLTNLSNVVSNLNSSLNSEVQNRINNDSALQTSITNLNTELGNVKTNVSQAQTDISNLSDKKQDILQFNVIPDATTYAGRTIQYIGNNASNGTTSYIFGYFYRSENSGSGYEWKQVNVQPESKGTLTNISINNTELTPSEGKVNIPIDNDSILYDGISGLRLPTAWINYLKAQVVKEPRTTLAVASGNEPTSEGYQEYSNIVATFKHIETNPYNFNGSLSLWRKNGSSDYEKVLDDIVANDSWENISEYKLNIPNLSENVSLKLVGKSKLTEGNVESTPLNYICIPMVQPTVTLNVQSGQGNGSYDEGTNISATFNHSETNIQNFNGSLYLYLCNDAGEISNKSVEPSETTTTIESALNFPLLENRSVILKGVDKKGRECNSSRIYYVCKETTPEISLTVNGDEPKEYTEGTAVNANFSHFESNIAAFNQSEKLTFLITNDSGDELKKISNIDFASTSTLIENSDLPSPITQNMSVSLRGKNRHNNEYVTKTLSKYICKPAEPTISLTSDGTEPGIVEEGDPIIANFSHSETYYNNFKGNLSLYINNASKGEVLLKSDIQPASTSTLIYNFNLSIPQITETTGIKLKGISKSDTEIVNDAMVFTYQAMPVPTTTLGINSGNNPDTETFIEGSSISTIFNHIETNTDYIDGNLTLKAIGEKTSTPYLDNSITVSSTSTPLTDYPLIVDSLQENISVSLTGKMIKTGKAITSTKTYKYTCIPGTPTVNLSANGTKEGSYIEGTQINTTFNHFETNISSFNQSEKLKLVIKNDTSSIKEQRVEFSSTSTEIPNVGLNQKLLENISVSLTGKNKHTEQDVTSTLNYICLPGTPTINLTTDNEPQEGGYDYGTIISANFNHSETNTSSFLGNLTFIVNNSSTIHSNDSITPTTETTLLPYSLNNFTLTENVSVRLSGTNKHGGTVSEEFTYICKPQIIDPIINLSWFDGTEPGNYPADTPIVANFSHYEENMENFSSETPTLTLTVYNDSETLGTKTEIATSSTSTKIDYTLNRTLRENENIYLKLSGLSKSGNTSTSNILKYECDAAEQKVYYGNKATATIESVEGLQTATDFSSNVTVTNAKGEYIFFVSPTVIEQTKLIMDDFQYCTSFTDQGTMTVQGSSYHVYRIGRFAAGTHTYKVIS